MYGSDSFFTLTVPGQIGLVVVSVLLSWVFLFAVWNLSGGRQLVVRLCVAMTLFVAFVWLTPQFYYVYYLLLFDTLSWQIVVDALPNPASAVRQLFFLERDNLSHHSRGALGWFMIGLALLRPRLSH